MTVLEAVPLLSSGLRCGTACVWTASLLRPGGQLLIARPDSLVLWTVFGFGLTLAPT